MQITRLILKDFRNLNLEFSPYSGINLILGKNGAGKSNLLDSIYYLAFAKSFRTYADTNNIVWNSSLPFASINGQIIGENEKPNDTRDFQIIFYKSVERQPERKKLLINGVSKAKRTFVYQIPVILFAPHNINLLAGSPDIRREELDDFICSVSQQYLDNLGAYKSVIRNRNKILQKIADGFGQLSELSYWDQQLVELGALLIAMRLQVITNFLPSLHTDAGKVFQGEFQNLDLQYLSKFTIGVNSGNLLADLRSQLAGKIKENRQKELAVKKSLYGPHRDDFSLIVGGRDLKIFASRGQQRIATLILKMAMFHYLTMNLHTLPVILLDDIMSELDVVHRNNLANYLLELSAQIFMSATETSGFSKKLIQKSRKIKIGEN